MISSFHLFKTLRTGDADLRF